MPESALRIENSPMVTSRESSWARSPPVPPPPGLTVDELITAAHGMSMGLILAVVVLPILCCLGGIMICICCYVQQLKRSNDRLRLNDGQPTYHGNVRNVEMASHEKRPDPEAGANKEVEERGYI